MGEDAPLELKSPSRRSIALVVLTVALGYGAARVLWPYVTALVLGAWVAHLTRPLFRRLGETLGGRQRAAALLTGALVVVVAAPVVLAVTTLVPAASSLVDQLRGAGGGRGALTALVSSRDGAEAGGAHGLVQLVREHGLDASKAAAVVAGASLEALVGVFVFFVVFFAALVDGPRASLWLEQNAPIDPLALARLREAFFQAGRGLLVGNGITALVQGGIATVTYLLLGVPRALLLGLLSVAAALVPMTGPTIVWVPVAAGLLLTGHPMKAAILTAVGIFVVGTADNVLRPWLSTRARVGMDSSLVLLAIFGGIAAFGGWGLLLGPLVVRLAMEAIAVVTERTGRGRPAAATSEPA